MSIISRFSITNPAFLHIETIKKRYVLDYNKKFAFYLIICEWKLHFSDTIVSVKSDNCMSKSDDFYLGNLLLSKIRCFEISGHKFSHISKMNTIFISELRNMTHEQ